MSQKKKPKPAETVMDREPLRLGAHTFRQFSGLDAAFGADSRDYPNRTSIPEEHRNMRSKGCNVASSIFFKGGRLSDHGLRLKSGVDAGQFNAALRALLCSFAPPHEVKIGTCGWLIETYTEAEGR